MSTPTFIDRTSNTIAPGFLVASPKLDDTPFERAVVVMVDHDDQGAMGFIVNKPLEIDFGSIIQSVDDETARNIEPESYDVPVHFGGPVRVEQLWLMFQRSLGGDTTTAADRRLKDKIALPDDSALTFSDDWHLAASGDLIEEFATGDQHGDYRPLLGYCGWGEGQLEAEIEEGSWLLLDFDGDFVLETVPDVHWEDALDRLGVDPAAFLMMGQSGMA